MEYELGLENMEPPKGFGAENVSFFDYEDDEDEDDDSDDDQW